MLRRLRRPQCQPATTAARAGRSTGRGPELITAVDRARTVRRLGRQAGFDLVRITTAHPLSEERARFHDWLRDGRHGGMRWMTPEWADRCASPADALSGARSVVLLGLTYWPGARPASGPRTGHIARYAWGRDYHAAMGEKLRSLADSLRSEFGGEYRWHVDTSAFMEKALAARAGLGWYGKNTNVLTSALGSFVLLGGVVTTLELPPDEPLARDCGACRLCVSACPTGAIGPAYTLDARRCISYLTIEHRGPIDRKLRPLIGDWVFGCDICQEVCPPAIQPYLGNAAERRTWGAEVRAIQSGASHSIRGPAGEAAGAAVLKPESGWRAAVDLVWLLQLTHEEYVQVFRGSAVRRAKVWMLRRNAAVALGNVGEPSAVPMLSTAAEQDPEPIVRAHAAWALGRVAARHGVAGTAAWLRGAAEREPDEEVRAELRLAAQDAMSQPAAAPD